VPAFVMHGRLRCIRFVANRKSYSEAMACGSPQRANRVSVVGIVSIPDTFPLSVRNRNAASEDDQHMTVFNVEVSNDKRGVIGA
jgi:hypothetical protein